MEQRSPTQFDPCSIFPARVGTRPTTAKPMQPGGIAKGTSDPRTGECTIPLGNNAYDRTVRRHEAGHAIYSPRTIEERDKTYLGQGLEDARLHAVCLPGEDVPLSAKRDELASTLIDLRHVQSKDMIPNKGVDAVIGLRSAAILATATSYGLDTRSGYRELDKACAKVHPRYRDSVINAITMLQRGENETAREILKPYFPDSMPMSEMQLFPVAGKKGDGTKEGMKVPTIEQVFDKIDGKLTTEAASMMSDSAIDALKHTRVPIMHIRSLQAVDNIPTIFGDTRKHVASGAKIRAKKLVLTISPTTPRIFLKEVKYQGGSVLIDASGSMRISEEALEKLVSSAPMATIAFYNAPSDDSHFGNLWIYSTKGKRALDLHAVNIQGRLRPSFEEAYKVRGKTYTRDAYPDDYFGYGNVVDLQAIQWLLQQDAPRYYLTDGGFTGTCRSIAYDLLCNGLARKKFIQVRSLAEMYDILNKKGRRQ